MVQDGSGESSSRGVAPNGGRLAGGEAGGGRRLRALALASFGALLAVGAALAPAASAQGQPQEQEIGLLFAQTANRGTMKPIKGTPRFNLKLLGVNPQVVWFSDRPARQSGHIPVPEFTRSWAGFGFVDDPPNAALTLLRAADHQDTVVMELGRPHFKRKRNKIRYSAQVLDEATGNLSHLNSDLDPRVKRRFRSPSLFIDDAAGTVVNGCLIQPYTRCPRSNLFRAFLEDANLRGADLRVADLREANLFRADLREALLIRAALVGANLAGAELVHADLRAADLSEAFLFGAFMGGANLSEANLSVADLNSVDLREADLREADLRNADLSEADLRGANLSGANLSGANLTGASVHGIDLGRGRFCRTTMPDGSISNRDC